MPKDLKGKPLPKGIYQRKDGRYEARALINGVSVQLYNFNLKQLKIDFENAKEEARKGVDKKLSNITLDEWFDEWFERYKVPKIKETSITPMKTKYRSNFGRLIGNMKVSEIRNMDIQGVINTMQKEGRATSSMRDALGRVRECLESAKNNRIISENPCFDVTVPWENKTKERRFLSQDEQNRFLLQVENNWYKEMFYVMFLTGMRIGEVGGLKWNDVDFKNKCININRSLSCEYHEGVKTIRLTTPKTHNSYRKIPFMGEVEEMLLSQKKKQDRLRKELGKRYRSDGDFADLVFVTSMGSPVLRYHAEKECKKVVKAINEQEAFESVKEQREPIIFKDVYPHAIRHTFCSRCFQLNMNPKVVQALMGHQHYSTTIDIYTHVMEQDINEEVCKMESAIS
ncbi:tyrosine-type recombinase/integrase [[Clostridium] scindens]|uniref:tyrosine-type recombinase/integrase n=1 Tax=Clostridium scindens (strain JCM 10418 / VPI 12708) TaxID=29347 RepID=UPI00248E7E8A|nr:site-specific integrase [[Clostridium] scindens]